MAEPVQDTYARIREGYDKATNRYARRHTVEYSLRLWLPQLLEGIKQPRALDIACGTGWSSRIIRDCGATEVVGLDITPELIEVAISYEQHAAQANKAVSPISYVVGDAANFDPRSLGQFDLATGILGPLHYAKKRSELRRFIQNAYRALRRKRSFLALMPNPELMPCYSGYGVSMHGKSCEGSRIVVTLRELDGTELARFHNWLWSRHTYEQVLREAGFTKIEWLNCLVSPEAIERDGQEFWQDCIDRPDIIALVATKP